MKPLKKIEKIYEHHPYKIRYKAKLIVYIIALIIVALVISGINDYLTADWINAAMETVLLFVISVCLVLVYRGHYHISVNIILVLAFLAMTAMVILKPPENVNDVFKLGFYYIPLLFISCLLGYAQWQIIAGWAACIAAFAFEVFFRLPAVNAGGLDFDLVVIFINAFVIFSVGAVISFIIVKTSDMFMTSMETRNREKTGQLEKLTTLFETSRHGLAVGDDLMQSVKDSITHVNLMTKNLDEINIRAIDLLSNVKASTEVYSVLRKSKDDVNTMIEGQKKALNQSSSVVGEIVDSIIAVSDSVRQKESVLNELVATATGGSSNMNDSIESISNLLKSSDDILEVISLIEGIASRTNLLAMNAAIEAAHAGESGRGFAVVAEEIRKLSEETNENSRLIRITIEKNIADIQLATDVNQETVESFRQVIDRIGRVEKAILEITESMSGLKSRAEQMNKSLDLLLTTTDDVNHSVVSMDDKIAGGIDIVRHIGEEADKIKLKITELLNESKAVLYEVNALNQLGLNNKSNMNRLLTSIEEINTGDKQV
ncbi:MAG: hypothetical protein JW969_15340 [Spirochaetales bacterium]|nr:hypothetical protein [Spirochaetales bacterium]